MSEAKLRLIALFFYFSLQDEKLARQASIKAIAKIRKRQSEEEIDEDEVGPTIVLVTQLVYDSFKKFVKNNESLVSQKGGWILPETVDLGPWKQFRKESEEDEFLTLLWSRVLQLKDDTISKGLGISVGTVRHRVGRGLKTLGKMVAPQPKVSGNG